MGSWSCRGPVVSHQWLCLIVQDASLEAWRSTGCISSGNTLYCRCCFRSATTGPPSLRLRQSVRNMCYNMECACASCEEPCNSDHHTISMSTCHHLNTTSFQSTGNCTACSNENNTARQCVVTAPLCHVLSSLTSFSNWRRPLYPGHPSRSHSKNRVALFTASDPVRSSA